MSATASAVVVTDANGEKTTVDAKFLEADSAEELIRFYVADNITKHLIDYVKYAEGTVGYTYVLNMDLSAWAGQTVTIKFVCQANDGGVVNFNTLTVNVPAAQ